MPINMLDDDGEVTMPERGSTLDDRSGIQRGSTPSDIGRGIIEYIGTTQEPSIPNLGNAPVPDPLADMFPQGFDISAPYNLLGFEMPLYGWLLLAGGIAYFAFGRK